MDFKNNKIETVHYLKIVWVGGGVFECPRRLEGGVGSLGAGVTGSREPPDTGGYWELNLGLP